MNNELLKKVMIEAISTTAEKLFRETDESFYYFTLITSGEAHAPIISAWSKEKLALLPEAERQLVKWSYADSPYFDFNSEGFDQVRILFGQRPDILSLSEPLRSLEYEERLSLMEAALSEVDARGVFGRGSARENIVINVEVMPPDYSNTERALRLNPSGALREWLDEAGE
jgi:hypothetical protein